MSEMILWPWDGWGEAGAPNEPPPMKGEVARDGDVEPRRRSGDPAAIHACPPRPLLSSGVPLSRDD